MVIYPFSSIFLFDFAIVNSKSRGLWLYYIRSTSKGK
ncbi:hypothetical protein Victoria_0023 [Pseudomonas phage Victoria]|uniref:Uncharacterized protein n=1 Tax=Pseudomonas phage vB_PaeM_PE1 TaxID=3161145 RepID=A0AAU8EJ72_9CAUD|nr:hypothetical protein E2005C_045 [Pseudomonas phage E2005-C]WPF70411.1 hypothetical protein [Pseudomonas phage BL3]WPK40768.1 hypothetical protein Victoria_0023 [Pseudomonas phage Victoria]